MCNNLEERPPNPPLQSYNSIIQHIAWNRGFSISSLCKNRLPDPVGFRRRGWGVLISYSSFKGTDMDVAGHRAGSALSIGFMPMGFPRVKTRMKKSCAGTLRIQAGLVFGCILSPHGAKISSMDLNENFAYDCCGFYPSLQ